MYNGLWLTASVADGPVVAHDQAGFFGMGIRFYCPECGRRMNVKTFLAGKRGICPHCDARWEIPLESEIPEGAPKVRPASAAAGNAAQATATSTARVNKVESKPLTDGGPVPSFEVAAPTVADPIEASPDSVWYVRPASGGEFGPARGDVMRRWIDEGRVGADSMVWREGWPEWQLAGPVFPALTPAAEQHVEPAATQAPTGGEPKSLASLASIQKKTVESNGRAARKRSVGSGKSIAAVVILGLMIVALFVVLLYVLPK